MPPYKSGRRKILSALGIVALGMASLPRLSDNTDTDRQENGLRSDEVQLSNLEILDGPKPGSIRIAFTVDRIDDSREWAAPMIRFFNVYRETLLTQYPYIDLEPDGHARYEMGFVFVNDSFTVETGDTLLVSVGDQLVKTAEVQ